MKEPVPMGRRQYCQNHHWEVLVKMSKGVRVSFLRRYFEPERYGQILNQQNI